jgi:hypothetical protein
MVFAAKGESEQALLIKRHTTSRWTPHARLVGDPDVGGESSWQNDVVQVVQPPSRALRRLAGRVDSSLGIMNAARNAGLNTPYEAHRHAWTLGNLVLRNAEAVTQLCRTDSVLLPAAWCNARAALEISGRHQWLLQPDDPWIGEARLDSPSA